MGLKQSIVVVNEYSVKTKKGGSRGGTPGNYVVRYMTRDKATEDLTPVRLQDTDLYITRYMARKDAAEKLSSVPAIKQGMRDAQGLGGVAFGYGEISLSHKKVKAISKDIQDNFDNGKTVMKTVLSFDEEYLRKHNIIDSDFYLQRAGEYRGNVDQMKLRMAIMSGLDRMGRDFDDLKYIGVIQVDTKHLHCHLAMVDRGKGKLASDGKQKGKLSAKNMRELRRGIDMFLDEQKHIQKMTSNITHDRNNALCFIKKFTHKTMEHNGLPQFLLSCLPSDKNLWRAGTNRKEMKKPNAIVRQYVIEVLNQPNSGFFEAMSGVTVYARHRLQNEDLTGQEYRQLITSGRNRIIEDCMNGVYSVLKTIPDNRKVVQTPMLDVMSMDYIEMADRTENDPMIEFGFKLRSYSSRLEHHKKERDKYHEAVNTYENTQNVSEDSKALYDFFKLEEEYNAMLMCKYHHFLSFLPESEEYEEDFDALLSYRGRLQRLDSMMRDPSFKRRSPDSAEEYGRRVYNMHGGRFVTTAPQVLQSRYVNMQERFKKMESDFRYKLAGYGLTLDSKGVSTKKPYEFDSVKSLDLHHLAYDFPYDAHVSKRNVDLFVEMADRRYTVFQKAKQYLVNSGQPEGLANFDERDIVLMKDVADKMRMTPVIETRKSAQSGGKRHNGRTVSLDGDYTKDMELAVKSIVQTVQFEVGQD